ncbi:MAG: FG-GAP repeat domain-containing protein, partial [Vicinamibacterales bacterium]
MTVLERVAPLLFVLLVVSSSHRAATGAQASARASGAPPPFVDVTAAAKIDFVHRSGASPEKQMVETFGSGVAWIDYDNDGFADLYFVNGAPGAGNVLYHNNKDGTFADVTSKAGVSASSNAKSYKTGVAVGDYDNDGFLDFYVTAFGPNILFRNNGDGTFTDVTEKAGVAGGAGEWSTSTGFFDFDRDGDLDLYVTNYLDYRLDDNLYCGFRKEGYRMYCEPTLFDGMADRLFRNNGDGTFTDVTAAAGVAGGPSEWSTSTGFLDFDRDGDLDLYVTNYLDFRRDDNPYCGLRKDGYRMYCHPTMFDGVPDRLFRNNGNG